MIRETWFYIIILLKNCLPVTGFSILENEIAINHLEPVAVESDILQFDSEYDDSDIDRLKEMSISSNFFLSFKNDQKTKVNCQVLSLHFFKANI